jgi:BirA family transcriptional regulator, biotin operon repressor / biotin---[acetyl-CoA-carboxylase] ligase
MHKSDYLDSDRIREGLNTGYIGSTILVYKSTSSTNDVAAEYSKNKSSNGLVVFAEEQTAGRGRASNKWLTGSSDSLLCSAVLTDCILKPELLSLTCAVAVAQTIGNNAKIKWPNDIIVSGKKIAGILIESKTYKTHNACIIGTGINCHQKQTDFPPELQDVATSIDVETNSFTDRIRLAKMILESLEHSLETAGKNPGKILDKWQALSIQLHHRVTVIYNRRKFAGSCIGIDPEKGLILQLDTGPIRFFDAAHTAVAKMS